MQDMTRSLIVRVCATVVLAGWLISGLGTGIGDAAATVTSVTVKKDLKFGDAAGDADLAGTVVVSPAGGKSVTGGVTDFGGIHGRGDVQLRGDKNGTYACTLPGSIQVTSGANSATVDTFILDPNPRVREQPRLYPDSNHRTGTTTAFILKADIRARFALSAHQISN